MSRLSNFAMEFVPHSSNFNNYRLLEYLKMGSSIFDSNNGSFSSWPEYGVNSRLGLEQQPRMEDNGLQMFYGSNLSAPASVNESGNYFKMANFNSNNATFPPLDFNMADLNVAQPNAFASNSLDINFGRPALCRNTQMPAGSDELFEFTNKNLESDLEAIWKDAEVDECTTRVRDFSLSSDTRTNNSHQSSANSNHNNKSTLSKARQIVGRGAGYYQRYGTECISIPKDGPLNYPPNRKVESLLSSQNSIGDRDKSYRKKQWKNAQMECAFCKNISQDYTTHWLKNSQNVIICPVLRAYTCPICKNCGGDNAHTMRYCPLKRQKLAEEFQRTKSETSSSSKSNWRRTKQ